MVPSCPTAEIQPSLRARFCSRRRFDSGSSRITVTGPSRSCRALTMAQTCGPPSVTTTISRLRHAVGYISQPSAACAAMPAPLMTAAMTANRHQADGAADGEQDAVAFGQGQPKQRGGEGRQPVAERDRQGDDDRQEQRDDADDPVALLAPERPVARADQAFEADQAGHDPLHEATELLGAERAIRQECGQPGLLAAIDHLRRDDDQRDARARPRRRAAAAGG